MNTMSHKGYTARVEFDERDNIFVGRVLGIRTMISGLERIGVRSCITAFSMPRDFPGSLAARQFSAVQGIRDERRV